MTMQELTQEYYTLPEAMELLHVSRRSVYNYISSGKLKATKTASGTWRISALAILDFLGVTEAEQPTGV